MSFDLPNGSQKIYVDIQGYIKTNCYTGSLFSYLNKLIYNDSSGYKEDKCIAKVIISKGETVYKKPSVYGNINYIQCKVLSIEKLYSKKLLQPFTLFDNNIQQTEDFYVYKTYKDALKGY